MGMFVTVIIQDDKCRDSCKECADTCPVSIFGIKDKKIFVLKENEDECTFCNFCIEKCPYGAIEIKKEY